MSIHTFDSPLLIFTKSQLKLRGKKVIHTSNIQKALDAVGTVLTNCCATEFRKPKSLFLKNFLMFLNSMDPLHDRRRIQKVGDYLTNYLNCCN